MSLQILCQGYTVTNHEKPLLVKLKVMFMRKVLKTKSKRFNNKAEAREPKQLELPKPMPQTVTIPYPGRWLVVTNEFDQNKVIVKNIDGNNCVEAKIHRKIISETHLMADLLMELAKRMRVLDGEASPSRLETPILESKCRTILF